ncbi:MAG: hypothetical protein QOE73_1407 [Verrucomicrobiota bacterium]|jgi:hypothetical protein
MKKAFGMFALTKREQRMVIIIMLALIAIALAKHYRDVGTIMPVQPAPSPRISATPSSFPEEERAVPHIAR